MPKTKEQKKVILDGLAEKISKSKSVVFAKFDALGVKENEELREKLRADGSEYQVTKKTLLELAFRDQKIEGLNPREFEGRIAAIFGYEDEISPAKVLNDFKNNHEGKIDFVGGVLEGKFLATAEVVALAKLPSKKELYAKLVGSMNAPINGFVNVLAGNLRGLVTVLKAVEEKKA